MLYPFQNIFDWIFPPTNHEILLRPVTPHRFATWYRPNSSHNIVYLSEYHLPEVQAAIAACKFEHNYHAAKLLSALVYTHLATLPPKRTLLIPVPLSRKRQRKRLFNQVERVLKNVGSLPYPSQIQSNLLVRTVHTAPQTSQTRAKRLSNLQGVFAVVPRNLFVLENIERVIICDDVLTTGATLREVRATLSPFIGEHIELICLAWAH